MKISRVVKKSVPVVMAPCFFVGEQVDLLLYNDG